MRGASVTRSAWASRDFAGLRGTSRDFAGLRGTSRGFAGLHGTRKTQRKNIKKIDPRYGSGERGGCDLLKGRLISWANPRFLFAGTALDSKSESEKCWRWRWPRSRGILHFGALSYNTNSKKFAPAAARVA